VVFLAELSVDIGADTVAQLARVILRTASACRPWRLTRSSASLTECAEEYRLGIRTTCTRCGPMASAAIVAVSAESIPPDRARMTEPNPFFST
jgi:hypothetical protein